MSDQVGSGIQFGDAGQAPSNVPPTGDGAQPKDAPAYVTIDAFDKKLSEWKDQVLRDAQSRSDKALSSIQKRINGRIEEVERSFKTINGVELTDDQRKALRSQVVTEVLTSAPEASDPLPAAGLSTPPPAQGTGDNGNGKAAQGVNDDGMILATNKAAEVLYKSAGIVIEENDEEAKSLDHSNPAKFLESLAAALESKRARMDPNRLAARSAGLAVGGTVPNQVLQTANTEDLWNQAKKAGQI